MLCSTVGVSGVPTFFKETNKGVNAQGQKSKKEKDPEKVKTGFYCSRNILTERVERPLQVYRLGDSGLDLIRSRTQPSFTLLLFPLSSLLPLPLLHPPQPSWSLARGDDKGSGVASELQGGV